MAKTKKEGNNDTEKKQQQNNNIEASSDEKEKLQEKTKKTKHEKRYAITIKPFLYYPIGSTFLEPFSKEVLKGIKENKLEIRNG